ncbi:MAG: tetratricopeptide repeat protein, partial [Deltaproteobacteria bacterium]|nr:tetratricopeptide repeat protein [Deltaproteobacteria bacterium]
YSTESHYDNFYRDYMNREVTCRYFFRLGEGLYLGGKPGEGLRMLRLASAMGYDDTSIHSDLGVFYADHGLFEKARGELEKALEFHDNLSGVLNNWGYCYHKEGEYEKAVPFFKRAIHLEPDNHSYYNNLGFTLIRMGDREGAASVFRKSLSIKRDQPEIVEFMRKHDLPCEPDERISQ